jgi:hypothetical protein
VPIGERVIGGAAVISPDALWAGGPLQAPTILSLPLTLGGLVLAFVVIQWLVDRRDPKLVEAPVRKDDDSVGFE